MCHSVYFLFGIGFREIPRKIACTAILRTSSSSSSSSQVYPLMDVCEYIVNSFTFSCGVYYVFNGV